MTNNNASVLIEKLHDQDPSIRRRAIRDLVACPSKESVEAVVEGLADPNKGVQNTALESLIHFPHEMVVDALLPVIRGSDLNSRNAGMSVLKSHGAKAVERLLEALEKAQDIDELIQILVVLGNIGSPIASTAILNRVSHEDDNVKTTAIEALGKIQDPKSVKTLINTYHQFDILKYSILEALGNIAVDDAFPVMMSALDSEDVLESFSGIGAMGAMEDSRFVAPLLKKLQKEEDAGTRRLIIKSLSQIEEVNPGSIAKLDRSTFHPIISPLLEQVDSAEYPHILNVASALKDEQYANSFINALDNSDAAIVKIAFNALMKLGETAVRTALGRLQTSGFIVQIKLLEFLEKFPHAEIPKIVVQLVNHVEDMVRQGVAKVLSNNVSNVSFEALKGMLKDIDEQVRRFAVLGLKKMISFDGAIPAIIGALKDLNGHVRREAAWALAETQSREVIEPLFDRIVNEPYGDVREAISSTLALRKDKDITKRIIDFLDGENSRIRETLAKTIWECDPAPAVESLIKRLSDREWRVVVNACQSLEKMKDLKAIFPLRELLKNEDWQIRRAALSALRVFKSKELKPFFIPLLNDSNSVVAKLAVEALSELNDSSLDVTLQKSLEHKNWEVRYQVVKALGKLKSQKSVDALIKVVEKDSNNGVRAKALLALGNIRNKKAFEIARTLLENEDNDLVIAAIKFFLKFDESECGGLDQKLQKIFLFNPWIKAYFMVSFRENVCPMLEKVMKAVTAPREWRRIQQLKTLKQEPGISCEETFLLTHIISEKCGIELLGKNEIEAKLSRNLERFNISNWIEYYHSLKYGSDDQNLLVALHDSITDPMTGFFGEPDQNKVLVKTIIPELIKERINSGVQNIRILSAGCSYGPESYSIAMSILEDVHSDKIKISVTGVDISHICLNTAKRGIYKREILRNVDRKFIDLYFEDDRGDLRIKDEVKNMVEFRYMNLSSTKEMDDQGTFDVVICRNVFSVFSQKEKEKLAENIYNVLAPGGTLFIAGKESLYNVTKAYKLQTHEKVVAYRKM
ncbi:MAG: HEAT repeat domain-containing protein [Candidatus Riflebacteria bacterium]|nr:HEAT repeat domain-containing protein [Candidatus Riflebacteria bacterium]